MDFLFCFYLPKTLYFFYFYLFEKDFIVDRINCHLFLLDTRRKDLFDFCFPSKFIIAAAATAAGFLHRVRACSNQLERERDKLFDVIISFCHMLHNTLYAILTTMFSADRVTRRGYSNRRRTPAGTDTAKLVLP